MKGPTLFHHITMLIKTAFFAKWQLAKFDLLPMGILFCDVIAKDKQTKTKKGKLLSMFPNAYKLICFRRSAQQRRK